MSQTNSESIVRFSTPFGFSGIGIASTELDIIRSIDSEGCLDRVINIREAYIHDVIVSNTAYSSIPYKRPVIIYIKPELLHYSSIICKFLYRYFNITAEISVPRTHGLNSYEYGYLSGPYDSNFYHKIPEEPKKRFNITIDKEVKNLTL